MCLSGSATVQNVVKLASYVIPETDFSSFMVVEKMPIRSCLQMEVKLNLISITFNFNNWITTKSLDNAILEN